jgi:protein-disulfide isomerase
MIGGIHVIDIRRVNRAGRLGTGGLVRALLLTIGIAVMLSGMVGCSTPEPSPTQAPTIPVETQPVETKVAETPVPDPDATPEATREPLIPLDDDPVMGSPDAPVTLIEYSEYLCPFCRRFVLETLPLIEEQYIDTGQVKLIFRDFPVHGQPAVAMALVAECAADQDKFWEMHYMLWERTDEWSQSEDLLTTIQGYASELGLDGDEYMSCLEQGTPIDRIREDYEIAVQDGVSATPTFFINGTEIRGAQPFEEFQRVIEEELAKSG